MVYPIFQNVVEILREGHLLAISLPVTRCVGHNTDLRALLLPVTRCVGHNADLPSNSNIWKMVRVNIVFTS